MREEGSIFFPSPERKHTGNNNNQTAICIKIKELEPLYKSTNMFTREADGRSLQPEEEAVVE